MKREHIMQKKLLGVAGCAALMFGLIACSGEDGANGVNGLNGADGKNGADGASCEVKALSSKSGYKVLCGGDSVGVLLNGTNGAKGKNGTNGTNGTSCSVEGLKNASLGYKVLCGGDSVGVLLNGAAGQSCTTTNAADGIVITCGDAVSKIKICSAATVTKDGKTGLEMTCNDKVVGTVWDGDDGSNCTAKPFVESSTGKSGLEMFCDGVSVGKVVDGTNCVSKEGKDGVVELSCGDQKPITVYKAICGTESYDPAEKFCVLDKLYDKCGEEKLTYTVNTEYCNNGKVEPACFVVKQLKDVDEGWNSEPDASPFQLKIVNIRAPKDDEFCLNGFIMPKCNNETYDVGHFCGKTFDQTQDSLMEYCSKPSHLLSIVEEWEEFLADAKEAREKARAEESDEPSLFGTLIDRSMMDLGEITSGALFDEVYAFFSSLNDTKLKGSQFCQNGEINDKCGTETYATKTQFCDKRDNHIYGKVDIESGTIDNVPFELAWMTENLVYEYHLPKVTSAGKVSMGSSIIFADTVYQNNVSLIPDAGRYYSWYAAVGYDDARFEGISEGGEMPEGYVLPKDLALPAAYYNDNTREDRYLILPGACPAGWRLPSKDELEYVIKRSALLKKLNVVKTGYYNVTFEPIITDLETTGYTKDEAFSDANKALFWTYEIDADDEDAKKAIGLNMTTSASEYEFASFTKDMELPIRCVSDFE